MKINNDTNHSSKKAHFVSRVIPFISVISFIRLALITMLVSCSSTPSVSTNWHDVVISSLKQNHYHLKHSIDSKKEIIDTAVKALFIGGWHLKTDDIDQLITFYKDLHNTSPSTCKLHGMILMISDEFTEMYKTMSVEDRLKAARILNTMFDFYFTSEKEISMQDQVINLKAAFNDNNIDLTKKILEEQAKNFSPCLARLEVLENIASAKENLKIIYWRNFLSEGKVFEVKN